MNKLIMFVSILVFHNAGGQNLVPNHSFEQTDCTTLGQDLIYTTQPWFSTNGETVDSYNTCKSLSWVKVPNNQFGYQEPASGSGYAGIRTYMTVTANYREYLGVKLIQPLIAGEYYYIGFKYNVGDYAQYSTDDLGAYITAAPIPNSPVLNFIPQVSNPQGSFLKDRTNWNTMGGYYLATGGEEWLVIGNFNDDSSTSVELDNPNGLQWSTTYFYIDDVVVEECATYPFHYDLGHDRMICPGDSVTWNVNEQDVNVEWMGSTNAAAYTAYSAGQYYVKISTPCNTFTDTINITYDDCDVPVFPNVITPNGDGINDYFNIHSTLYGQYGIHIFNRWGIVVFSSNEYQDNWSADEETAGVYYYRIIRQKDNQSYTGFIQVIK